MKAVLRVHVQDLSVDQLHPLLGGEDAGADHPFVFLACPATHVYGWHDTQDRDDARKMQSKPDTLDSD